MFNIKNTETCGGKIRATNFESYEEAQIYAVRYLLSIQNLIDHTIDDCDLDIHNAMRREGLEIVEN